MAYYHDGDDLRRHDEAFFAWLDFECPDDQGRVKKVPKVFAPPDRAFAKRARQEDAENPLPGGATREQDDITLPIVGVSRFGDPELDFERFNMSRVKLGFTDGMNGTYVASHPDPYNLTYQVDLWGDNLRQMNAMMLQYLRTFTGDIAIMQVRTASPPSQYREAGDPVYKICELFNDGIVDTSEIEGIEDKNRKLRKSITVRAKAWLMKEAEVRPTVRRLQVSLESENDGVIETAEYDEDTIVTIG